MIFLAFEFVVHSTIQIVILRKWHKYIYLEIKLIPIWGFFDTAGQQLDRIIMYKNIITNMANGQQKNCG